MNIGQIRDKMDFHSEFSVDSKDFRLRIYCSRTGGIYEWQFAAIIWHGGKSASYDRANSYGYDKIGAAASGAFYALLGGYTDPVKIAAGGENEIPRAIAEYLTIDKKEVHHAHG
jgi:hypothetical protein